MWASIKIALLATGITVALILGIVLYFLMKWLLLIGSVVMVATIIAVLIITDEDTEQTTKESP